MRANDVYLVQRAGSFIEDLGAELDRQLQHEPRPAERLRMLRETTNRITRAANDAVYAYQRASGAVRAELANPNGNMAAARETRVILDAGRSDVLRVLAVARRRYPWTDVDAASRASPADGEREVADAARPR